MFQKYYFLSFFNIFGYIYENIGFFHTEGFRIVVFLSYDLAFYSFVMYSLLQRFISGIIKKKPIEHNY